MKNMNIRLPKRLKTGDKIGVVAPAGPYDSEKFSRGVRILEKMGFAVHVPENLLDPRGFLAGVDEHRAEFINRLFADRSIDAIVCARGGYGSLRILDLIDYGVIADNPKIFIGFSDITALLWVLFDRCGLVTFHGPVVTSLAESSEDSRKSLFQAISSGHSVEIRLNRGITVSSGNSSGILCGGNLNTLCHLVGTPYVPCFDGRILFLEDRAEAPYKIDRMLTQMKLARCFKGLAGVVLGSFEDCGPMDEILQIIKDIFAEYRVPIMAGLDSGHGRDNLTLPMGIEAALDADRHVLSCRQAATV